MIRDVLSLHKERLNQGQGHSSTETYGNLHLL